jgi:chemotaxis protein methyltransferase CheR
MESQPGVIPVPPQAAGELLSDPWYFRLKEYLIESTGLGYYADKDADLARRILRRLSRFHFQDCASYLEKLRDPQWGPAEMDALIGEITIGESYFFRHREHFDALRDIVLPDIIARNAETRRIRIWCAGCADGAEPYSLSILLRRDLAHLLFGWDVSVLGTDISRQGLAAAREGRFEEWSFRTTSPEIRQACFEQKGKHWTVAPEFKAGVTFQIHNLVENAFPLQLNGTSIFDLIICRNVMIYFGPELMRRIVGQFHGCLSPDAWLLVGPSEPNMTCFTSFHAVNAPGVTLYRRPATNGTNDSEPRSHPEYHASSVAATVPQCSPLPAAIFPATTFSSPTPPQTPFQSAGAGLRPTLAGLRERADRGDWESAARYGRELLEAENLNALAHLHYALVLEQLGDFAGSERSLRRAIYLDRQSPLAHYHLGLLLQSSHDLRQAMRCFDNTLKVLASQPDDRVLTDADGITVAELGKLALMRVEALTGQI